MRYNMRLCNTGKNTRVDVMLGVVDDPLWWLISPPHYGGCRVSLWVTVDI